MHRQHLPVDLAPENLDRPVVRAHSGDVVLVEPFTAFEAQAWFTRHEGGGIALAEELPSPAMENRQYGIRANVLVPGGIEGERVRLLREMAAQRAKEHGDTPPPRIYPDQPMEMLDPEWIGRYVSFLISEDGRHINGQARVIDEAPRSPLQAMFPDI